MNKIRATIAKEFTFDAAHQIPWHKDSKGEPGKCSRLHGHTYRVIVYAHGAVQPVIPPRRDSGMVIDFGDIGAIFKDRVDRLLDHQFLNEVFAGKSLDDDPEFPLCATAEVLAAWILMEMREEISQVFKVRVYETPTAYAEVDTDDIE